MTPCVMNGAPRLGIYGWATRLICYIQTTERVLMTSIPYTLPTFRSNGFNCPYCRAFADQTWLVLRNKFVANDPFYNAVGSYYLSRCNRCNQVAVWLNEVMLIPDTVTADPAHPEMPDAIKSDFEEARNVLQKSLRAAAALLRLCVQKLCKELGEPGENINDDIASLVKKGLPVEVQQSLDIVRVVGNEQVHPGQIDVRDDPSLASELFALVNFIVEDRISRPKLIKAIYDRLPPKKLEGIKNRDA
jgi:hypothetical protein